MSQGSFGTGPFSVAPEPEAGDRRCASPATSFVADEEAASQGTGAARRRAVRAGACRRSPTATPISCSAARSRICRLRSACKLARGSLQFDPASGLFGLIPLHADNHLDDPDVRRMLSQAIDRDAIIAALGVPGLAPRATLLEPSLDQLPAPVAPAWLGTPLADRLPALRAEADRKFGKNQKPTIRVALPEGPGADALLGALARFVGRARLRRRARAARRRRFPAARRGRAIGLRGLVRAPVPLRRRAAVRS